MLRLEESVSRDPENRCDDATFRCDDVIRRYARRRSGNRLTHYAALSDRSSTIVTWRSIAG